MLWVWQECGNKIKEKYMDSFYGTIEMTDEVMAKDGACDIMRGLLRITIPGKENLAAYFLIIKHWHNLDKSMLGKDIVETINTFIDTYWYAGRRMGGRKRFMENRRRLHKLLKQIKGE
jgi:hypothetical protein